MEPVSDGTFFKREREEEERWRIGMKVALPRRTNI
jgi:hypothetical protein